MGSVEEENKNMLVVRDTPSSSIVIATGMAAGINSVLEENIAIAEISNAGIIANKSLMMHILSVKNKGVHSRLTVSTFLDTMESLLTLPSTTHLTTTKSKRQLHSKFLLMSNWLEYMVQLEMDFSVASD